MLKHLLVVTVALAGLTAPAWAGESNGEVFPGPDAGVSTTVAHPHFTQGSDAPFNFFNTSTPTQMSNYAPAPGGADDPYPFKMQGQMIRVAPAPSVGMAYRPGEDLPTHG